MNLSAWLVCSLIGAGLLAPCTRDSEPEDASADASDDAGDPALTCPGADHLLAAQRARIREATRSPDGLGWCCPPTRTPTCDCAPPGGFVADRCECGGDWGVCDAHPLDWHRGTDEHGCDRWLITMAHSCTPTDARDP
ncbi:MAG: hypothetical protein KF901_34260 [Myxococcales bacterium]|nr:hypothetical protein [Myxococcales bacterium]